MSLTLSNFGSSAIDCIKIEDNIVKLVYKSNKDKEYSYNCSNINLFTIDIVTNILNSASVGNFIHQQRKNNNLQEI